MFIYIFINFDILFAHGKPLHFLIWYLTGLSVVW